MFRPTSILQFSSVQFSRSVVSDSLRPHESQHTRPPCPSPTPGVHSESRPSSQWWHPAISSWVIPFSSCPQSLPASKSFPMSQLFAWGGQSTGVSALASFFLKKSPGWYYHCWCPLKEGSTWHTSHTVIAGTFLNYNLLVPRQDEFWKRCNDPCLLTFIIVIWVLNHLLKSNGRFTKYRQWVFS